MLKKGMEILELPVFSLVCKQSVKHEFMIWDRISWAVVFDGIKDCIFSLAAGSNR